METGFIIAIPAKTNTFYFTFCLVKRVHRKNDKLAAEQQEDAVSWTDAN